MENDIFHQKMQSVPGAVGSGRKKVHAQWKHGPRNGIKSSKDRD